jgi:ligand-binding sensor domain-containing protein
MMLVRRIVAVLLAGGAVAPSAFAQPATRLVEHVIDGFSGLALVQDLRGYIWCGTEQGLLCYDGYTAQFLRSEEDDPSTISADHVNSLAIGPDGQIWAGTSAGLDRLDPVTRKVRRLALPASGERSDGRIYVTAVLVDSTGTVWVGTQEDGVFEVRVARLDGRDTLVVKSHRHRPDDTASLSHDHVHALAVEPGTQGACILVGTSSGLTRLHVASGACESFRHDPERRASIPHDEIWAIIEGEADDVWIGTGAGVCRMTAGRRGPFERLSTGREGPVFTLAFDAEGFLWFGTHASTVVRYDPRTTLAQTQSIEQEFYGRRYLNGIYSSLLDRHGSVWFGVHYGIRP